jgi:hypothetical protein
VVQTVISKRPGPGGYPRRCRTKAKNASTTRARLLGSWAESRNVSWTRSDASSPARVRGSKRSSTKRRSRSRTMLVRERCQRRAVVAAELLDRDVRVARRPRQEGVRTHYPRAAQQQQTKNGTWIASGAPGLSEGPLGIMHGLGSGDLESYCTPRRSSSHPGCTCSGPGLIHAGRSCAGWRSEWDLQRSWHIALRASV